MLEIETSKTPLPTHPSTQAPCKRPRQGRFISAMGEGLRDGFPGLTTMVGRIVEIADDRRHLFVHRGFMVVKDTEGERKS